MGPVVHHHQEIVETRRRGESEEGNNAGESGFTESRESFSIERDSVGFSGSKCLSSSRQMEIESLRKAVLQSALEHGYVRPIEESRWKSTNHSSRPPNSPMVRQRSVIVRNDGTQQKNQQHPV